MVIPSVPGQTKYLLYNRASDKLIVVTKKAIKKGACVHRVYVRPVKEESYRPIAVQNDLESQEGAVSCENAPFILYNAQRIHLPETSFVPFAADWAGVRRVNLVTGENQMVFEAQNFKCPEPYATGFVCGLIAAWPDGSGAVCKVGLQRPIGEGGLIVDYFVYDLCFTDGLRRRIASLGTGDGGLVS